MSSRGDIDPSPQLIGFVYLASPIVQLAPPTEITRWFSFEEIESIEQMFEETKKVLFSIQKKTILSY